ncbi:MAG: PIN domain-containing protein [Akkermansiaceae bacterium]|jgi:predicted nucleic acid-binding protein
MNACFDTSTLVAALLQQHPHHAVAFPRLKAVHDGTMHGHLTTHGLAELFATLTALPLKPRLLPTDVQLLIQRSVLSHFTLIPLGPQEYQDAMVLTVSKNLSSGAIYDALHLVGARVAGCQKLFTLNLRHFQALAPGDPMVTPPWD